MIHDKSVPINVIQQTTAAIGLTMIGHQVVEHGGGVSCHA